MTTGITLAPAKPASLLVPAAVAAAGEKASRRFA